jgi:transposase
MEGSSQVLSVAVNVLAPIRRMVPKRGVGQSLVAAAAKTETRGQAANRGVIRRWDVFPGEKRGSCVGKTKRGKGTKIMVLTEQTGLPWGIHVASASPHEVKLIEPLLEQRQLLSLPRHLLYDLAADSDALRERCRKRRIHLVCPYRANRSKPRRHDGRRFRRFRRRWKVERSIAWLQNFRRLVVRYEHGVERFLGFVQLACLVMVARRF